MGKAYSSHKTYEIQDCLICWEQINSVDLVMCNHCNIQMHANCEEVYRNTKGYCKCPHCQNIGTLASQNPHNQE